MTTENSAAAGFAALGIDGKLLDATEAYGLTEPKPIQVEAIPAHLSGRDIVAIAQTGSGKTAAFALPILAKIAALGTKRLPKTARALVLAPTRELAVQIEDVFKGLAKGLHLSTALVLGGVSRHSQVKRLSQGVDVLIATPGRLTDLVRERDVVLSETRWLVLDEADRMLDMGFINDVRRLARATHPSRQTALFSATMPSEVEALADGLLKEPLRIAVAPQGTTAVEIDQSVQMVPMRAKRKVLAGLLATTAKGQVIVFARTKHGADKVVRNLVADGFEAAVIHGNKSQNARQKALTGFREGSVRVLVATDIAARGIDVPGIGHIINYELPDEPESYVHRIGRTGRNGASGAAITLCDPAELSKLKQVEKIIRMRLPVTADLRGTVVEAAPDAERPEGNRRSEQHHAAGRPGGRPHRGQGKPQREQAASGSDARSKPEQAPRQPAAAKPAGPRPAAHAGPRQERSGHPDGKPHKAFRGRRRRPSGSARAA